MSVIVGTVSNIEVKNGVSAKTGRPWQAFTAIVNGTKISLGFQNRGIQSGNTYEFTVNHGKYGAEYVSHTNAAPGASSTPAPAASRGGETQGPRPKHYQSNVGVLVKEFPLPIDHPDRSIIRQNAMGHAMRALELSGEAIGLTSEAIIDAAVGLAMKVENYATGDLEEQALQAAFGSSDPDIPF